MLGWYVHTSFKMNYKATFRPQEILCPVTHRWVPLDKRVRALLDEYGCCRLAPQSEGEVVLLVVLFFFLTPSGHNGL